MKRRALSREGHVKIRKRITGLPRRCMAPLRGPRPAMSLRYAFWSFLSGTLGILAICEITTLVGHPLLIGSFGASAVLLFGATDSPLAQPRNLVGGHLVSAGVAVVVVALFGSSPLTMALGVGLAIFVMNLTHTTHPPGGATALIGVQGAVGPGFILLPVLAGALILLATAIFTNNVVYHRSYPKHWL
ncbi:MAG: HPP family protein [Geobacteraceae bacterium]|nr:HPP family protein [Geobacteraceae bacterium]